MPRRELTHPVTPPEDIALVRAAIDASGLSDAEWARRVAWRDRCTVRDWLAGRRRIPRVVVEGARVLLEEGVRGSFGEM